jgi:hypothetical protein
MNTSWQRSGLILPRDHHDVIGDPCIVWDDEVRAYRMFLFMAPPGHGECLSKSRTALGPGDWSQPLPIPLVNPSAVPGDLHKPFIVMDPVRANTAARIDGRYCLLFVAIVERRKLVYRAWSETLAGPWELESEAVIPLGGAGDFDEKHVDAVTGYYFAERGETLFFYMGYPERAQARAQSPWGSAQAVAIAGRSDRVAQKLGVILEPSAVARHWAGGWIGGLQLVSRHGSGWRAVVNASPTAPNPSDSSIAREEPAPSLGGFAYTDEAWPVSGWRFESEPIEWIEDVPDSARHAGEGTNLWRQHVLVTDDGTERLYYNSGYYGQEQLYMKLRAP